MVDTMIRVESLTYSYPTGDSPALRDVSLDVSEGQFVALVGANGAGKSTLCYALTGFVPHFFKGDYSGSVTVAGHDIARSTLGELAGEVGLVFSNPFNQITGACYTVRDEVAFGLENLGVPREEMIVRVEEAITMAGLDGLGDRSPFALSGGQQQRLAIASIIVMRPRVLVLDEPTSQLDPVGSREVFELLDNLSRSGGATVVLVEQKLEWIAVHADRVIVLHEGQVVVDGDPRSVLSSVELARMGAGNTRHTQAARQYITRPRGRRQDPQGLGGPLPVTLEQTVEYLSQ
jgi:energy-coupling factor transporter ATP-binding protein EcfA2